MYQVEVTMVCKDSNFTSRSGMELNVTDDAVLQAEVRHYINHIVLPIIFAFGMVGNILNLVVFGYRVHTIHLEQLERSATAGLISLAVSDFLFCLVGFPAAFFPQSVFFLFTDTKSQIVGFYYNTLKGGFHNLFLFTSTWLVVAISTERYIAVCHPLRARWIVKVKKTIFVHLAIFAVGVLLSLPELIKNRIIQEDCWNGCMCIRRHLAPFLQNHNFKMAYHILWATIGTYIPLVALIFTNTNLVLGLLRSRALSMTEPDRYSCGRITRTVVAIVFSFLVLVCPSMIIESLISTGVSLASPSHATTLGIGITLLNLLQGIKFASNFLLYCAMNKQFRDNLRRVIRREKPSKMYITSEATKRTLDVEMV